MSFRCITPIIFNNYHVREISRTIPTLIEHKEARISLYYDDIVVTRDVVLTELDCDGLYDPNTGCIIIDSSNLIHLNKSPEHHDMILYNLETALQHETMHAIQDERGEIGSQYYSINSMEDYWDDPLEQYPLFNDIRRDLSFKIYSIQQHLALDDTVIRNVYLDRDTRDIDSLTSSWYGIVTTWLRPLPHLTHFRSTGGDRWQALQHLLRDDKHYA